MTMQGCCDDFCYGSGTCFDCGEPMLEHCPDCRELFSEHLGCACEPDDTWYDDED